MTAEPETLRLEAKSLSHDSFARFGTYAGEPERSPDWIASGTRVGGVREDADKTHGPRVAYLWNLGDLSYDGDVPYVGFVRYFHQGFRVSQLERHPHETQTWLARRGTSFVVVAPETGPEPPPPESVAAFVVEPGDLIAIGRGVWMCHFFPLGPEATYNVITSRRQPEQDRDLVDLSETANTVLEITLPTDFAVMRTDLSVSASEDV